MRIGELARQAGCSVEAIRYYEREGLLSQPGRNASNYRLYDRSHRETLCFIRNCRALEMSLEEIKVLLLLKFDSGKDCGEVNVLLEKHIAHVESRIDQLEDLKEQLKSLRSLCSRIQPRESCAILQGLAEPSAIPRGQAHNHVPGVRCSKEK